MVIKCLSCGHEALCIIEWKNKARPCEGFYHQGPFEALTDRLKREGE